MAGWAREKADRAAGRVNHGTYNGFIELPVTYGFSV
jgi:hypothetical protein